MSTPFQLHVPRQIYEDILAQARAELPNECCGLLAGRMSNVECRMSNVECRMPNSESVETDGPRLVVTQRYPLKNAAASSVEFWSDPRSMFDAVRDMRRLGIDILAVYHSHPCSEPIPSKTDLERNYSPDVVNLIISLSTSVPQMRAWWLTADGFREAELTIA